MLMRHKIKILALLLAIIVIVIGLLFYFRSHHTNSGQKENNYSGNCGINPHAAPCNLPYGELPDEK